MERVGKYESGFRGTISERQPTSHDTRTISGHSGTGTVDMCVDGVHILGSGWIDDLLHASNTAIERRGSQSENYNALHVQPSFRSKNQPRRPPRPKNRLFHTFAIGETAADGPS